MDFDRLREVEVHPVAPGRQRALGDGEDHRVPDQDLGLGGMFKDAA
jgi:hypothetical protein